MMKSRGSFYSTSNSTSSFISTPNSTSTPRFIPSKQPPPTSSPSSDLQVRHHRSSEYLISTTKKLLRRGSKRSFTEPKQDPIRYFSLRRAQSSKSLSDEIDHEIVKKASETHLGVSMDFIDRPIQVSLENPPPTFKAKLFPFLLFVTSRSIQVYTNKQRV